MLDPADWEAFRRDAHRVLDDAVDYLRDVHERPVWQPVPEETKQRLQSPLPLDPAPFDAVYAEFRESIMPYATGNIHPRFWGWVHGSGTPGGAIADLLAATMNANVGGREHAAVYVERQVVRWFLDLFSWPAESSGVLLSGTSVANGNAAIVARTAAIPQTSRSGVNQQRDALTAYGSSAAHASVTKAMQAAGLGTDALRTIETDDLQRVVPGEMQRAIAADRAGGKRPFLIIGNAGTVDTGAIDPLDELAGIARREGLWFHVDGAFGATAYLEPGLRERLRGIERADSIAFDFHKWLHVPYDCGCLLVRDGEAHRAAFAGEGAYLKRMDRGAGGGAPWFADYGQELSRSFRALKVWFTIKEHGAKRLGEAISVNCEQARHLRARLVESGVFDVHPAGELQIVCFRPRVPHAAPEAIDALVDDAAIALQESGTAVVSSTTLGGRRYMRASITNQRTTYADLDALVAAAADLVRGFEASQRG